MSAKRWVRLATVNCKADDGRASRNNFSTHYRPDKTDKLGWQIHNANPSGSKSIKFDIKKDLSNYPDSRELDDVKDGDKTEVVREKHLYVADPRHTDDRFDVECYAVIEESDLDTRYEEWMRDYASNIADLPLNAVCMPGTHDSGTYGVSKHSKAGSDKPGGVPDEPSQYLEWSQAQGWSFDQQLVGGVRYFDLRIDCGNSGHQYITHSWRGERVQAALKAFQAFLERTEQEILLIHFQHLYNMSDANYNELGDWIVDHLGPWLTPLPTIVQEEFTPETEVGMFWEKGYRVIVLMDAPDHMWDESGVQLEASDSVATRVTDRTNPFDRIWPDSWIRSNYGNESTNGGLRDFLDEEVDKRNAEKFHVLQGQRTPTELEYIADTALDNLDDVVAIPLDDDGSLKEWAKDTTPKVGNWVEGRWPENVVNIVITDFCQNGDFLRQCIRRNR